MIRKERCYSSTGVCRGNSCSSAEINPFLLTAKAVRKKYMGGFAWDFLKMYLFSLIFLNVLGDVDLLR